MTDDAAPITQAGPTVVSQGAALPVLYRACLALIARRHRDGLAASPLLHRGGQIVAKSAGIEVVHLDANSTRTDYVLSFLNNVFAGSPVTITDTAVFEIS